jgi:hypothetical protein
MDGLLVRQRAVIADGGTLRSSIDDRDLVPLPDQGVPN